MPKEVEEINQKLHGMDSEEDEEYITDDIIDIEVSENREDRQGREENFSNFSSTPFPKSSRTNSTGFRKRKQSKTSSENELQPKRKRKSSSSVLNANSLQNGPIQTTSTSHANSLQSDSMVITSEPYNETEDVPTPTRSAHFEWNRIQTNPEVMSHKRNTRPPKKFIYQDD